MCQLGKLIKDELTSEPIEGYKGWNTALSVENKGKLFPLYQKIDIPYEIDKESNAILDININFLKSIEGFYAYNNYNYNNNYYNYNYNYNYNNYYTNYCTNYYCNYYIAGKVRLSGNIAHHELGYRATKAKPILLVKLTPKDVNAEFNKFIEHFNLVVDEVAKNYSIPTINHTEFK